MTARTHAGQLDVSPFPEILRARRRHLAQLRHHPWQQVDTAISDATRATHQALHGGTWTPGPAAAPAPARSRHLATGPGRRGRRQPGHPAAEIALCPGVVWLGARGLRAHNTSPAPEPWYTGRLPGFTANP